MLTHRLIWDAIDRLAERNGLSASGLAKRAGLDPTTFNRSKRVGKNGKLRWPTTESLAKILQATGMTVTDLLAEIEDTGPAAQQLRVPILPGSTSELDRAFDTDGNPAGTEWLVGDAVPVADPAAFGIEVPDERFRPYFRPGNLLIVSPGAQIEQGTLVLLQVRAPHASLCVREVIRRENDSLLVRGRDDPANVEAIMNRDLDWYSRIVFSSF